uniref:CRAL-TRIO domain-containing protein n=1 Tax=Globisporangium ultimum (strain ATCC 200006 / CBS 805.95 / DAOM BR144) TaxID=431595 RepID=K3WSE6_GLOUD
MTANEESAPLTAEDQQFYDVIKATHGDTCTEDFAIRMARAFRSQKKNRMQLTLAEAKRILDWRAAHDAETILTRELDNSKIYFDCWPGQIYGEDKEGHLITVDRIKEINIDAFQKNFSHIDQLLPHRVQYMERIQWEKAAVSKRLGARVYKHICIVDLKGLGMKHVSRSIINYLKPIFDIGQMYYPETLHRLYLINAPFVFYGAWKMIASLIDPETREKIQVFKEGDKFLEAAQSHDIPLESIPVYLGGGHHGRAMNNTFKPSVADTPLPVPMPTVETPVS